MTVTPKDKRSPTAGRGRLATNMALLGGAILIATLAGELVVRMVAPQKTMFPRYVESHEYALEFLPNTRIVETRGRLWRFVYTTNELGRRGPYVPVRDKYDRENIVVLGDSFTFGMGVRDGQVYTSVMSSLLGTSRAVINGGMSGWGLDSEIKWYCTFAYAYRPRFVVLQFTANDPRDFAGVTTIDDGEFEFHPYPRTKPTWQKMLSRSRFLQRSHLYALTRNLFPSIARVGEEWTPTAPSSDTEVSQKKYVDMLRLFAERLQEGGAKLLFVSVTALDRTTGEYVYDLRRFPLIENAITQLSDEGLLHFVALPLEQMQQYPGSPQGHQWGREHHRIVGTRIAETILALDGS